MKIIKKIPFHDDFCSSHLKKTCSQGHPKTHLNKFLRAFLISLCGSLMVELRCFGHVKSINYKKRVFLQSDKVKWSKFGQVFKKTPPQKN